MKMFLKIILMTFIFFSTTFSKDGDGREVIKAYEKGKPAKMDIEITKVKTYGEIDLKVDEKNKKIYTEIKEPQKILSRSYRTEGKRELIITENIDEITKESLTNEYNYRITDKGQIEIDYNEIPRSLYFWVMSDNSKKLYKGNILSIDDLIDVKNTYMYAFEREKVSRFINQTYTFKIGRVELKGGVKLTFPEYEKYELVYTGGSTGEPIDNKYSEKSKVKLYYKKLGEDISEAREITAKTILHETKGITYEILGTLPEVFTNKMDYKLFHSTFEENFKMKVNDTDLVFNNYKINTETFDDPDNNKPSDGTLRLYIPYNYNTGEIINITVGGDIKIGEYLIGSVEANEKGVYALGKLEIQRDLIENDRIKFDLDDSSGLKILNQSTDGYKKNDKIKLKIEEIPDFGTADKVKKSLNIKRRYILLGKFRDWGTLEVVFYRNFFSVDRLDIDFGVLDVKDIKSGSKKIIAESKVFSRYDKDLVIGFSQAGSKKNEYYLQNSEGEKLTMLIYLDESVEDVRRSKVVAEIPGGGENKDAQPGFYNATITMSITTGSRLKGGKIE